MSTTLRVVKNPRSGVTIKYHKVIFKIIVVRLKKILYPLRGNGMGLFLYSTIMYPPAGGRNIY